jgi:beta-glucanase (GH16 family)
MVIPNQEKIIQMNIAKKISLPLCLALALLTFSCKKDDPVTNQPVSVTLSIADASVKEGNTGTGALAFKVTLSQAASSNVLVDYATLNGTAAAGQDYVAKTDGQLIFAAGETEKTISIGILGDNVKESDESFDLLLLNPVNATLARAKATGTILNDDTDNQLVIPTTGYSTPLTYSGLSLVWNDEFDGTTLNSAVWTHEIGASGWGNSELQYYRPENTYLYSGNLIIEAKQENYGGAAYTSSRLVTKGKKEFKFGRIDIRAALPTGQGLWPALWMLGANIDQSAWPACGEIDIMELVGNAPGRVYGTAHYGANVSEHQQSGNNYGLSGNARFSEAFHVFSIVWESNRVRWYMDDILYHEITPTTLGAAPYPFNNPFFFIFNVAVGGNWPGSPDGTTSFPQRMIVDYVRVFQ